MNQAQKTVLITAGASGIGAVIAKSFLTEGAQVHVCDISESDISLLEKEYPSISTTIADVSDFDQVGNVINDVKKRYGKLDVLINNVGISGPTAAVEDIDPDDWDTSINVSLSSFFYVTKLAVPLLKKVSGCIINMGSNSGLFGCPLRSPYVAAKWAIIGLTKTWAMELGPHGIQVNAICPGSVNGPRIENVINKDAEERGLSSDSIRDVYLQQSSLRVFVEAEDIAEMALFLCSSAGKNISGQALSIDGNTENLSNNAS